MVEITFDDSAVRLAFRRLDDALDDMSPAMNEIGGYLKLSTQARIDKGVSPDGTPFAPRSPVTLARYDTAGEAYRGPLHFRGDMRRGIFHSYGRDYVQVGSPAIQSAVMHFGAEQGEFGAYVSKDKNGRRHFQHLPWGDIPARPFLGLSEEDRVAIIETIGEYLSSQDE